MAKVLVALCPPVVIKRERGFGPRLGLVAEDMISFEVVTIAMQGSVLVLFYLCVRGCFGYGNSIAWNGAITEVAFFRPFWLISPAIIVFGMTAGSGE